MKRSIYSSSLYERVIQNYEFESNQLNESDNLLYWYFFLYSEELVSLLEYRQVKAEPRKILCALILVFILTCLLIGLIGPNK